MEEGLGINKSLSVVTFTCDYCKAKTLCITTNPSDNSVSLCQNCINYLFQRHEKEGEFLILDNIFVTPVDNYIEKVRRGFITTD